MAHIRVKKLHFEAAGQFRVSQDDLEKGRSVRVSVPQLNDSRCVEKVTGLTAEWAGTANGCRYGYEVARLQIAEGLVKKAQGEEIDVGASVLSDLNVSGCAAAPLRRQLVIAGD